MGLWKGKKPVFEKLNKSTELCVNFAVQRLSHVLLCTVIGVFNSEENKEISSESDHRADNMRKTLENDDGTVYLRLDSI